MIVVVGPSGAGKDSLMELAATCLARRSDIVFVRRMVTRAGDAGGEAHQPISHDEFEATAAAGGFAVSWRAHGHGYGIPAPTIEAIRAGRCLVANGSRTALADFAAIYPTLAVIQVTADRECLIARLTARGRETAAEIRARVDRPKPSLPVGLTVYTVDNSGDLSEAGRRFAELVEAIADRHARG
ncbi:phosphonate metabolism protein/1,5-bisphosphokinase (PRPP-forming) PhnN [Pleomorphomonas oryzae]|uniref:phosphonate metabolism protein/1,5-bisphosphokinase (PRPP-forming) PhnN n=1 Tax=Pleomorphomonas oryzae TaxID=261934 RepID=UPI0003F5D9C6|nr:phosphonate metabolism protein/1,5-bisphosphokinase (PRPP-forming) PhnN [Pleomorphomonas oryzae]